MYGSAGYAAIMKFLALTMSNGKSVLDNINEGTPEAIELLALSGDSADKLREQFSVLNQSRNNEAHISPTASEQEINAAINIIITMYFFATGSCITDLEMNGHNIE